MGLPLTQLRWEVKKVTLYDRKVYNYYMKYHTVAIARGGGYVLSPNV